MCESCYKELGSPVIINENTLLAFDLIDELLSHDCTGGICHPIVSHWEVGDEMLQNCLKQLPSISGFHSKLPFRKSSSSEQAKLLRLFAKMSVAERVSALAMHSGLIHIPKENAKVPLTKDGEYLGGWHTVPKRRQFICESCSRDFVSNRTMVDVLAEKVANGWGDLTEEQTSVVCDGCYQEIMEVLKKGV